MVRTEGLGDCNVLFSDETDDDARADGVVEKGGYVVWRHVFRALVEAEGVVGEANEKRDCLPLCERGHVVCMFTDELLERMGELGVVV